MLEMSMEPAAPMSSFQQHVLPDPIEMSATKLMNQQWIEAYADRLKQVDTHMDLRKRLSNKGKQDNPNAAGDGKGGKGKSGAKGKGKTKKSETADKAEENA